MAAVAGFGIASSFFVYSILPELAEIAILLYVFAYLLAAYFLPGRRHFSRDRSSLLGPVLACSGFFLIGIVLDLVEEMPAAGVYVSAGFVDFSALYLLSVGGVVAFWALRGRATESPAAEGGDALSSLPLTKREREIVGLMLGGETNAAIAERLFISESTVKKHVNNVFRKLGISSRWELLKLAGPPLRPKE
jgi:DNA-binding CsgD family transcriptional regulator